MKNIREMKLKLLICGSLGKTYAGFKVFREMLNELWSNKSYGLKIIRGKLLPQRNSSATI